MLIDIHKDARHTKVLLDFVEYCNAHPTERFWQALLNWSGKQFILFSDKPPQYPKRDLAMQVDTFYLEGKNK